MIDPAPSNISHERSPLRDVRDDVAELVKSGQSPQAQALLDSFFAIPTQASNTLKVIVYLASNNDPEADRALNTLEPVSGAKTFFGILALRAGDLVRAGQLFREAIAERDELQIAATGLGMSKTVEATHATELINLGLVLQLAPSNTQTPSLLSDGSVSVQFDPNNDPVPRIRQRLFRSLAHKPRSTESLLEDIALQNPASDLPGELLRLHRCGFDLKALYRWADQSWWDNRLKILRDLDPALVVSAQRGIKWIESNLKTAPLSKALISDIKLLLKSVEELQSGTLVDSTRSPSPTVSRFFEILPVLERAVGRNQISFARQKLIALKECVVNNETLRCYVALEANLPPVVTDSDLPIPIFPRSSAPDFQRPPKPSREELRNTALDVLKELNLECDYRSALERVRTARKRNMMHPELAATEVLILLAFGENTADPFPQVVAKALADAVATVESDLRQMCFRGLACDARSSDELVTDVARLVAQSEDDQLIRDLLNGVSLGKAQHTRANIMRRMIQKTLYPLNSTLSASIAAVRGSLSRVRGTPLTRAALEKLSDSFGGGFRHDLEVADKMFAQGELVHALHFSSRAMKAAPFSVSACATHVRALFENRKLEAALTQLQHLELLDPTSPELRELRRLIRRLN